MKLYIFNSRSHKKEEFIPIDKDNIRLYQCGPTVYDRIHIGNGRSLVVFDSFVRFLRCLYSKVTYVRNITDIDDKIIDRAAKLNISTKELTEETTKLFHEDCRALNVTDDLIEPKASEHIAEMIELVEILLQKGFAYENKSHVLFDSEKLAEGGLISLAQRDELIAGVRINKDDAQKKAADFVLWKPSKEGEPGWDSPWGYGRPGWHLECSAMSKKYLNEFFDIHTGGQDLIFPHHENEIAQSCCAYDMRPSEGFAKYWMHNGMLVVDGQKMSKSLGNFTTVEQALSKFNGEVVRLALMSAHYHQPLNWTESTLEQSFDILNKFYNILQDIEGIPYQSDANIDDEFKDALLDDFNVPKAIARLHVMASNLKVDNNDKDNLSKLKSQFINSANVLGIMFSTPKNWFDFQKQRYEISESEIERLIELRNIAKQNKEFSKADEIRDELTSYGITIKDSKDGTSWS